VWSNEPESYTVGSLATGSFSHAEQMEGDGPDRKGPDIPVGDWGVRLTNISSLKKFILQNPNNWCRLDTCGEIPR
jgi:hypothetical protein